LNIGNQKNQLNCRLADGSKSHSLKKIIFIKSKKKGENMQKGEGEYSRETYEEAERDSKNAFSVPGDWDQVEANEANYVDAERKKIKLMESAHEEALQENERRDNLAKSYEIVPKQYCEFSREVFTNRVIKTVISVGDSDFSEYEAHYYFEGKKIDIPYYASITQTAEKEMEYLFNTGMQPELVLKSLSEISSLQSEIYSLECKIKNNFGDLNESLERLVKMPGVSEKIAEHIESIRAEFPSIVMQLKNDAENKKRELDRKKKELFESDGQS